MTVLGKIAIIGGGCYGTFYAGQLDRARRRGVLQYQQLLVVDQDAACQATRELAPGAYTLVVADWDAFLDTWLSDPARTVTDPPDMIVPSPLMPHLLASWLAREAQRRAPTRGVEFEPVTTPLGTPFDRLHPTGVRYVSWADWICPTHCVEPTRCPAIKGPRTWEMSESVTSWTRAQGIAEEDGPVLFPCRHLTDGVGMYPAHLAAQAVGVLDRLLVRPDSSRLVVGSVSACHGAIAVLRIT